MHASLCALLLLETGGPNPGGWPVCSLRRPHTIILFVFGGATKAYSREQLQKLPASRQHVCFEIRAAEN